MPEEVSVITPEMAQGVKLKDGLPVYMALIDSSMNVPSPAVREQAVKYLERLAKMDPHAVMSCAGKTREEANWILRKIHERLETA